MKESTTLIRVKDKLLERLREKISTDTIDQLCGIQLTNAQLVEIAIVRSINPYKDIEIIRTKKKFKIKYE